MKKNIFNPNYILNQFKLLYKYKNIEHKTKYRMLGIDERMHIFFAFLFTYSEIMSEKSNLWASALCRA